MILDKVLSYNDKIIISVLIGSIWIYFRSLKHYALLPRKSIISVILVGGWIYLNYIDPLFLPIGLGMMVWYSTFGDNEIHL
jgi:hypothetical protein